MSIIQKSVMMAQRCTFPANRMVVAVRSLTLGRHLFLRTISLPTATSIKMVASTPKTLTY